MRFNDGLHPASIVQAPKYVLTLAVKLKKDNTNITWN